MTKTQQYIHIDTDGVKRTYKDRDMKILHCENGPAVEGTNGYKAWYVNGKLNRIDGPAVEGTNGYKAWYVNGNLHRIDGPAVERSNGSKQWHVNGNLHRIDGPAVEWSDGTKSWYVDGELFTEKEFNDQISPTLELTLEDISAKFGVDINKLKIIK